MQLVLRDIKPARIESDALMNDDRYFAFCQLNPKMRFERTADGKLLLQLPVGLECADQELEAAVQLWKWAEKDRRGKVFGTSVEYILPNRAAYSPDASWLSHTKLANLSKEEKSKFPHVVPEFIVEVRSPSDRLPRVKAKMREWIDNGVKLAWFIDGKRRTVTIYRQDREPEELMNPMVVVGEGPVKGFRLKMADVWAGL